jgi:Glycosyl transferase family 11
LAAERPNAAVFLQHPEIPLLMQQIVVQLFNGLGNQLFQYAAGKSLASTLPASLKLVHRSEATGPGRPLLLQQFAIDSAIQPMTPMDRLIVTVRPRLRLASRMARFARKVQLFQQDPSEISLPYEFDVDRGARSIYLAGYFQEYRLVRAVESQLREELVLRGSLDSRSQSYADRIGAARQPISVHLRRGDYLTAFGPRSVLPPSYYERAIEHMRSQFADPTFFVFSDDIGFARSWARAFPRTVVVDCNDSARAHECMHLMSLCRHHVIANSTFSWWGAWLNPRPDKQVVAPDTWLGLDTKGTRIACPEWQLLPAYHLPPTPLPERVARRA